MAVAAPVAEVGRLGVEDVAERRVTRVARAREHGEIAADFPREQHAVAVVGQEGVLQLAERLEILRPRHADGRAVVAVAPRHIVSVADFRHARVVAVDPLADFGVGARQAQVGLVDVPLQAVDREADVQAHAAVRVVAAENAGVVVLPFFERNDRRVENAVRGRKRIAPDDRIGRIAPHNLLGADGTFFPRHIRQCRAYDFQIAHVIWLLVYRHR